MQDCDAVLPLESIRGRIHSVETLGTLDGPGLRYVIFLQGCPMQCAYCHNPDSRTFDGGEEQTAGSLTEQILRYRNYLTGGVTFSGGEPLAQAVFVRAVTELLHQRANLHCAIDTSGSVCTPEAIEALNQADLILLDIKAFREETAVLLTGYDTRNAMRILDHCEATQKSVWIRCVLVPGITIFEKTADGAEITSSEDFVRANPDFCEGIRKIIRYTCVKKIELLPFHKMGEFKWRELGQISPLENTSEPSETCVDLARSFVDCQHCR